MLSSDFITSSEKEYCHTMDTSQPLSRTNSPPRCPICLEYHFADTAVLIPCGHKYDVDCISVQLKLLGEQSRQCPICRAKLEAVKYAFTPDGMCKIHIPGKGEQDTDPFLRDDEIIPPCASERERRRKIELRRLRTLEDISPIIFSFPHGEAVAVEGDLIIAINRELTLFLMQEHGVGTQCTSVRKLNFRTFRSLPVPFPDDQIFEPEKISRAREDIIKCLGSLGSMRLFSGTQIDGPQYEVKCDDRGLKAMVMRGLVVQRMLGEKDITIQESLTITEEFLMEELGEEELREEVVRGIAKEEREKEVRMARQEMQGVIEHFEGMGYIREHWRSLDRGSTGILEVVGDGEMECEYCDERHRNGDCILPNRG